MLAFKTPKVKIPLPGDRREHVQRYLNCFTSAGFTLLEIMVCLSIISIVLIAVYRMHSQTLLMNRSTQFYTTAPLLAQRRLTEVELNTPSDFSEGSGDFGDEYTGYRWSMSVSEVVMSEPEAAPDNLKRIDIKISFNQDELVYNLRTYRYTPQ
jgi:general secretion pathway protein I